MRIKFWKILIFAQSRAQSMFFDFDSVGPSMTLSYRPRSISAEVHSSAFNYLAFSFIYLEMQIVSSEFVSTFGQPRAVRLYIAGYSFEFIASFVDPHLCPRSYQPNPMAFQILIFDKRGLLQSSYFDSCVIAFISFLRNMRRRTKITTYDAYLIIVSIYHFVQSRDNILV